MSEQEDVQNGTREGQATGADPVARLVRVAGPRPGVAAGRSQRVRDAVHVRWRTSVSARRRTRWLAWSAVPLAAAAAWVVMVASGVWKGTLVTPPSAPIATLEWTGGAVLRPARPSPVVGSTFAPETDLETGVDGRVALRLRDGASVRLDGGSRVRLVSGAEIVLDRGAVYVDTGTAREAGAAILIRTPLGTVRDIGTRFQVRYSSDAVRVSVREGAASLEHREVTREATSGTQLTLRDDGHVTIRQIPPSGPEWDWVQEAAPPFGLEGRRLEEYLGWVERETGLRVEYADPSIPVDAAVVILHGTVEGLRPDETLEAVLPTCGLRHRVSDGSVIIERAAPGAAPRE